MSTTQPADGLDLGALLGALRRGWPLIALAALATAAAAALFAWRQPDVYEATSVVYVETQDADVGGIGEALGLDGGRSLANEVELLRLSSGLQEAVGARLLGEPDPAPGQPVSAEARQLARAAAASVSFAASERGSNMVMISARGGDPQQVARIANAYAQVYSERGRSLSRSGLQATRTFLETQADARRAELQGIEGELAGFLAGAGTVDLGQEGSNAVSQVAQLDAALEEARVELEVAQARRAQLVRDLGRVEAGLPGRISSSAQNEITALQQRVAQLQVEAGEYYARDPSLRGNEARAPELAGIVRRIEAARVRLDALAEQHVAESVAGGGRDGIGYVAELQRQVAEADVNIRGLQQRLGTLRQRQREYEGELQALPSQQTRLAQLERERAAAEQTYLALDARARDLRVAEEGDLGFVSVVRGAAVPSFPVAPNRPQTIVLGLVLGLLLGVGLALLRHASDTRIRTTAEVKGRGLRVIGTVPDFTAAFRRAFGPGALVADGDREVSPVVASGADPFSLVTEAFRYLRAAVGLARPGQPPRVLLVTSAGPGEGKSTVSMGLAVSYAQAGRRTLYVDADLRKPSAHALIGARRSGGLAEHLRARRLPDWEAHRQRLPSEWHASAEAADGAGGLYVLTAGDPIANPTEALASDALRTLLGEARRHFDIVVVDSSPVLPVPDALHVAAECDAAVLVAEAGRTELEALALAHEAVVAAGTDALGVVLNRASDRGLAGYGYGYGEAYGDGARVADRLPDTPAGALAALPADPPPASA